MQRRKKQKQQTKIKQKLIKNKKNVANLKPVNKID
jgi:hypothetical protein